MSKNCTLASRNCSRTSKIVLVTVKMVEVLIGERFDGENHTQSVILESMVVERSYVYTPRSLFSIILLHCGGVERISFLSSAFCTQKDRKQHSK